MEGNTQIEENREALKRILASLVAMAEMGAGYYFLSAGRRSRFKAGAGRKK